MTDYVFAANSTRTSSPDIKDDERVNLSGLPGVFNIRRACPEPSPSARGSGIAARPVWGALHVTRLG